MSSLIEKVRWKLGVGPTPAADRALAEIDAARADGRWADVVQMCEAALAAAGVSELAKTLYSRAADAYRETKNFDDVDAILDEALKRFPDHGMLLFQHADNSMARRRWAEGVARWRRVIAVGGAPVAAHEQLAAALRNDGRFDEADAALKAALAAYGNASEGARLRRAYAEVAMARTDWREAVARWEAAFSIDQDDYARIRYARALVAVRRLDDADSLLRAGVAAKPDHVGFLSACAELAARRGDWAQAGVLYGRVIEAQGDGAPLTAFVQANLAHRHNGALDEAERVLARGVTLYRDAVSVWGGGDKPEEISLSDLDQDAPFVSVRKLAGATIGVDIERIETCPFQGGLGNNGCFIHTLHFSPENARESMRLFEKWPINTIVRGQTLQDVNFYAHVYPRFDARRRALVPKPILMAKFGPEAMIVTEFVAGERVDGAAPPAAAIEALTRGIAALSSMPAEGAALGEIGAVSETSLNEFRRVIDRDVLPDSVFAAFRADVERLNALIYTPDRLVLCHNDLNWGNVLFSRGADGAPSPVFIDWGRCAKNVLGGDLLYYVPGALRGYSEAFFESVALGYAASLEAEGCAAGRDDVTIGAFYAAMQWAIERSVRTRAVSDVQLALNLRERLCGLCL